MNRWRSPVFAGAVLLGAALVTPWPARSVAAEGEPPVANQESGPRLADRLFRVEWTAGGSGQTESRIVGYVYNDSRQDAVNVRLRISELDASGRTVRSVIKPMGDPVPALGRASVLEQAPLTFAVAARPACRCSAWDRPGSAAGSGQAMPASVYRWMKRYLL